MIEMEHSGTSKNSRSFSKKQREMERFSIIDCSRISESTASLSSPYILQNLAGPGSLCNERAEAVSYPIRTDDFRQAHSIAGFLPVYWETLLLRPANRSRFLIFNLSLCFLLLTEEIVRSDKVGVQYREWREESCLDGYDRLV
jgi:hypothetical protein